MQSGVPVPDFTDDCKRCHLILLTPMVLRALVYFRRVLFSLKHAAKLPWTFGDVKHSRSWIVRVSNSPLHYSHLWARHHPIQVSGQHRVQRCLPKSSSTWTPTYKSQSHLLHVSSTWAVISSRNGT